MPVGNPVFGVAHFFFRRIAGAGMYFSAMNVSLPGIAWKKIYPGRAFFVHRLLPAALALGLFYELATQASGEVFLSILSPTSSRSWWLLSAALALMPVNWWAEVCKWRSLIVRTEPMSFSRAWQAVLAGVAVSLFTPNRVGEYGGRVLFVQPENRWFAAGATVLGNFAQALVLVSGGTAGLLWLSRRLDWPGAAWHNQIALIAFGGLFLLWLLYFSLPRLPARLHRYGFVKRLKQLVKADMQHWPKVSCTDLARQAAWAFFRCLTYSVQYYLLLLYFDVPVGFLDGFSGIFLLFLLQTGLPLPPLSGFLTRGNLAVALWGQFGAGAAESLAATFGLWIINLILPAFFGTFFLFYVRKAKDSSV